MSVSIIALDDVAAADAYEHVVHDPSAVAATYAAFARETLAQWDALRADGVRVQFHDGDHDYPNSDAMFADLFGRRHLWTRKSDTDGLPADHPMSAQVGTVRYGDHRLMRKLLLNDVFRAVHDVNGHGQTYAMGKCASFGPVGERNAWLTHRELYSDAAREALWCETRGQAAWTNAYGDHAALPLRDRPFAEQKAGEVPREFL